MGIEQIDRRIKLEERQRKHGRWRHTIGQKPEEQVLVAEKTEARKRVGGRQRCGDRDDGVKGDVDD